MVFSTWLEQERPNELPCKGCPWHLELIAHFACRANVVKRFDCSSSNSKSVPPQPLLFNQEGLSVCALYSVMDL